MNDTGPPKPKRHTYRFSLRSLLVFVTIAAAISAVGRTVWLTVIHPRMERQRFWQKHFALFDKVMACNGRLEQKRPVNIPRDDWENMVGWNQSAYYNCLEIPGCIKDYPRFERFVGKFEKRLDGEVSVATIDWIWDEIEAISDVPYDQYRPTVPFWISALDNPGEGGLPSKEEALRRLHDRTGQDFGDDVAKWREWFKYRY